MKKKYLKEMHTSSSKKGMGDFYGDAVKQKMGKAIDVMGMGKGMDKKNKKPPKSLA